MKKNKLIALALSFASFLIERIDVKSVILFGSIAKGTFDNESDIDLFIETDKKNENRIKDILELYKKTHEYEKFKLEGIENELSLKCGKLDEWRDLKRSIISGGIILFGDYQGKPDKLKHKIVFLLNMENLKRAEKIKIWRKIYGYKQKIGEKVYVNKGLVEKKLGRGGFMVLAENSKEIMDYLKKNKIKHSYFDIWAE